jgi:hypothetical protein
MSEEFLNESLADENVISEQVIEEQTATSPVIDGKVNEDVQNSEEEIKESSAPKEEKPDDKNFEQLEWVKRRLRQQEKVHRREMESFAANMQQQFAAQLQNLIGGNPNSGAYKNDPNSLDYKILEAAKKIEAEREAQKQAEEERIKLEQLNEQALAAMDKYSDYEDVMEQAQPYLTETMLAVLKELPNGAVENFYKNWKTNPDLIKKISRLSPQKQALEMARLDAEASIKYKVIPKVQQNPSDKKIISPLKPGGANLTSALDMSFSQMVKKHIRK